ncbi:hypothetical protein theurythT_07480 [Thalassotalea eurytherma]|uniref:Glycosyltransferase family 2 protein n=2 Tax=Thalassotalea eurytherma TaxID=1144278 RepID=A0ABQ6GZB9_9GAMM|nr:hypothetical protein theurythT_07480 [Thalassotalea eurytherma]
MKNKVISYCVPVMNRTDDIKNTLKWNVSVLSKFKNDVELIINNYDKDNEVEKWVKKDFSKEIKSGLLRFNKLEPLPYWHFCWAKNSFKGVINSKFYSSLDGDNFITEAEVAKTLERIKEHDGKCFLHHWSGEWGDGTSGRVTIPTALYKEHGYINELLPRQFDEISLLLKCITSTDFSFISRGSRNIINSSKEVSEFVERNELSPKIVISDLGEQKLPLNPRGSDYVQKDDSMNIFHNLNMYYALYNVSESDNAKGYFQAKLAKKQEEFCEHDFIKKNSKVFFHGTGLSTLKKESISTVYTVAKNEDMMLKAWYEHYKSIGIERFIIIDDHSDVQIEKTLEYSDVHVVRPRFGSFKTSKVFWIRTLMGLFQEEGSWLLTVDVDEFLDLPTSHNDFSDYVKNLDAGGHKFALALLLEMLPKDLQNGNVTSNNFTEVMEHHLYRPENSSYNYQNHRSVKWAFGKYWPYSFAIDFRFRYFGTVDSLRKIPLVKYSKSLYLNQGFHAVTYKGTEPTLDEYFSQGANMYLRHYKFFKFLCNEFDVDKYRSTFAKYHDRTKVNLTKISNIKSNIYCKSWVYSPFSKNYNT